MRKSDWIRPDQLPVENIFYFEGIGNYTFVYLENGEKILYSKTLGFFESVLGLSDFIRVSRKYVVNAFFLHSINEEDQCVVMADGKIMPISRRRKLFVYEKLEAIRLSEKERPAKIIYVGNDNAPVPAIVATLPLLPETTRAPMGLTLQYSTY